MSILPDFQDQIADAHERHYGGGRRSRSVRRIAVRALVGVALAGLVGAVAVVWLGGSATEREAPAASREAVPIDGRVAFVDAASSGERLAQRAAEQAGVEGKLRAQRGLMDQSEVLYRPGFEDGARRLATRLKVRTVVPADPSARDTSPYADALRGVDIAVVVGLDRDPGTPSAPPLVKPEPGPSHTSYQPIGQLALHAADGGAQTGQLTLFASPSGKPPRVAFKLTGEQLSPSRSGEAYAVWLVGGGQPLFLGFAPPVGSDGRTEVSGPRLGDEGAFHRRLNQAKRILLTADTRQTESPGRTVLEGKLG